MLIQNNQRHEYQILKPGISKPVPAPVRRKRHVPGLHRTTIPIIIVLALAGKNEIRLTLVTMLVIAKRTSRLNRHLRVKSAFPI